MAAGTPEEAPRVTAPIARRLFTRGNGRSPEIDLHVRGTNFQIKVWEALLRIPPGSVVSYEDIARRIRAPRAMRAVANAVAHNPVGWLIPCHRVIRKSGALGGYRWGESRIEEKLERSLPAPRWEAATAHRRRHQIFGSVTPRWPWYLPPRSL